MSKERIGNHLVKCTACNTIYCDGDEHVCKPIDYANITPERRAQYEDSMYMLVFAVIGCAIVGVAGFFYLVIQRFS